MIKITFSNIMTYLMIKLLKIYLFKFLFIQVIYQILNIALYIINILKIIFKRKKDYNFIKYLIIIIFFF